MGLGLLLARRWLYFLSSRPQSVGNNMGGRQQAKPPITNPTWGSSPSQLDPSGLSYNLTEDRVAIACREAAAGRSAIIVTLGQSLMGNSGDQRALYTPGSNVYNFNLLDRKCYVARDPLLGTTSRGANQATRLADLLVRRQIYDRVILVPLAYDGSRISQWAPGGNLHPRMIAGLRYAQDAGLEPTMILWQQGEFEAIESSAAGEWSRMECYVHVDGKIDPRQRY